MAEDICITGGAQGADEFFASCAHTVGHKVRNFEFPKHKCHTKLGERVDVVTGNYKNLDDNLKTTNDWLGRDLRGMSDYSRNLLRRNMAIALEAETAIYAVTYLVDDKIPGGSAWAVTRAPQMMIPVYIFNQATGIWHHNEFNLDGINYPEMSEGKLPPMPNGIYGAVGSRELLPIGHKAILQLYNLNEL